ncbi:MAG: hypothetical protein SR3Q1_02870 [Quinella sp. 3Q1]|nr:hypothetical protein [Quinella sp. 3Q1]
MGKNRQQKWINTIAAFSGGREATCPICGGHNFSHGYIKFKANDKYGWGAVWCEDCRNALWLSRVILTDAAACEKIIPALPADLKFI